jgi:putative Holliday junction resolvase
MKYMGIDYGTKRIGIAVSDESGEFAFPRTILKSSAATIEEILAIAHEEQVTAIIIGESLASNGVANALVPQTLRFKEKLAAKTSLPLYLEKDSFSTVEAHRYQEKKGFRDDSAAAIILQRFLDKQPH